MVKIDGDDRCLKCYDAYMELSNDYVVKIINKNGNAYGCVYEYKTE